LQVCHPFINGNQFPCPLLRLVDVAINRFADIEI
jgi:hypothetical protein